eukprot:TRINITY_DN2846_c2_g4_i1.p1 TRINITY_DN2846_c2_g4~~TRINITY_DN2846_c2_g4_i1.p1  ORF type:complete len:347 (-),score=65.84 TRINITY_DN2846_c2_g4_i1:258-1298(-)
MQVMAPISMLMLFMLSTLAHGVNNLASVLAVRGERHHSTSAAKLQSQLHSSVPQLQQRQQHHHHHHQQQQQQQQLQQLQQQQQGNRSVAVAAVHLQVPVVPAKTSSISSTNGSYALLDFTGFHFPGPIWRDVFMRSFVVVAVAEMFDKTWFVALICAVQYGRTVSFCASFGALSLHVLLAAALGVCISTFFSISTLNFAAAAVFAVLAAVYTYDFMQATSDDDVVEGRGSEAKEAMAKQRSVINRQDMFVAVFLAVFIAEFGDRTQVAMVTLHSSYPWVPVCFGSLAAFLVLTVSAVMASTLLEGAKLSEKLVSGLSAASFFLFMLLSLKDGFDARSSASLHAVYR